ncbi:pentapeptide repeat-containing protein [Gorillibacterium timonense]|uniref:pentapeptide repeat-containing protein n=1 Tax=Gorillibacterium timonense TaxID=1689269 RepID=UPI00071CD8D3|nr:pentapeptide repeat-containing protein [Gorillibacterium timonense]
MKEMESPAEGSAHPYRSECERCFGLCCVALSYTKSADFAFTKEAGTPCSHLRPDSRCRIHADLRVSGFRGCVGYECFGAGQQVSEITYAGKDWRAHPELAAEMFRVFPIMQQLYEMLAYLWEAEQREETLPIRDGLRHARETTEALTRLSAEALALLDVPSHRAIVKEQLLQASALVRAAAAPQERSSGSRSAAASRRGSDLIGARLAGADLRGAELRGALLIAADLRGADLRGTDVLGADFRDANLCGADLADCLYLTQAQVNAAVGDAATKLPAWLNRPEHWQS